MTPLSKLLIGALAVSVVFFAGCKSAPVYDVVAAPIAGPAGKTLSMDDVQKAIVRGGMRAGWQVLPEAPGRMTARYQAGRNSATVGIDYDVKTYSIKFRDTNLRNDGGTSVHKVYNNWVQSLDRSIRNELTSIGQ